MRGAGAAVGPPELCRMSAELRGYGEARAAGAVRQARKEMPSERRSGE